MVCFWVGDETSVPCVYVHGCAVVLFVSRSVTITEGSDSGGLQTCSFSAAEPKLSCRGGTLPPQPTQLGAGAACLPWLPLLLLFGTR